MVVNRDIWLLLIAQFATAFADNAILFTAITMAMAIETPAAWYIPALQASFLIAFILLAAWVGPYADRVPKSRVLVRANLVKAAGVGLMALHVEPLIAYAVVGAGAAMYSPAKYGILPELVDEDRLVKVNGMVEGSTILAIVSGAMVGAIVAEYAIFTALAMVLLCYFGSAVLAYFIRCSPGKSLPSTPMLPLFLQMTRQLLASARARFAILGVSLFWGSSAVLRVLIIAWAPVVLLIDRPSQIAQLPQYAAVGAAIGALLAFRFIPLDRLPRARIAAYAMGICILLITWVDQVWVARLLLLATGICGGMFLVPINAALQEIGHKTVGTGGAVAVQHFFENIAMLMATAIYAYAAGMGADPVTSFMVLGGVVICATVLVSWHLPAQQEDG